MSASSASLTSMIFLRASKQMLQKYIDEVTTVFNSLVFHVIQLFAVSHVNYTTVRTTNMMYVCPCIIYEIDERYPLDATCCIKWVSLVN